MILLYCCEPLQIGYQAAEPFYFFETAFQPFRGCFPEALRHRFQMRADGRERGAQLVRNVRGHPLSVLFLPVEGIRQGVDR